MQNMMILFLFVEIVKKERSKQIYEQNNINKKTNEIVVGIVLESIGRGGEAIPFAAET